MNNLLKKSIVLALSLSFITIGSLNMQKTYAFSITMSETKVDGKVINKEVLVDRSDLLGADIVFLDGEGVNYSIRNYKHSNTDSTTNKEGNAETTKIDEDAKNKEEQDKKNRIDEQKKREEEQKRIAEEQRKREEERRKREEERKKREEEWRKEAERRQKEFLEKKRLEEEKKRFKGTVEEYFNQNIDKYEGKRSKVILGRDRYDTSIKVAEISKGDSIVLANGSIFADSLSAFNISKKFDSRLVLIEKNSDISKILSKFNPNKVYIVGGNSSISNNVFEYIKSRDISVERIHGNNRYETNRKTLEKSGYVDVGVADGRNYPDALSASGLLSNKSYGLMLVRGDKGYNTNGYNIVYTFGGRNSVMQEGGKRLSGKDRYETSVAIYKEIGLDTEMTVVTSGSNFADALSSINIVKDYDKSAVYLVNHNLSASDKNNIDAAKSVTVVGGSVGREIIDLYNGTTYKVEGTDSLARGNFIKKDELEIYRQINEYRKSQGLDTLELNPELCFAARIRSYEISKKFSHTRPNGGRPATASQNFTNVGENIGMGYIDASAVMNGWKNSPGHNRNMLTERYTMFGVGAFYDSVSRRNMYVQIFY